MNSEISYINVFSSESVRYFQEVNPFEKVGNIVYYLLENAILSATFAPGEKLNIAKIASQLEVSATPVRDAIERLLAEGLVTAEQKQDSKYSNYYVFDITETNIDELYVFRKYIEGSAAYICAEHNWKVDLKKLGGLAKGFQQILQDEVDAKLLDNSCISRFDMDFHKLIVKSARNPYMTDMYCRLDKKLDYLSKRINAFNKKETNPENRILFGKQHQEIYNAIKLGFPSVAREAAERHVDFIRLRCMANRREYIISLE